MTIYMSRLFGKSNSSYLLSSGKAITSHLSQIRDNMFLIDTGITSPKITMPDDLKNTSQSQTTVGFIPSSSSTNQKTPIKTQMLERMFMDLVAGEHEMKERAIARFHDLVGGSSDGVDGEPGVDLPRRFMQKQVWVELNKIWKENKQVRGFCLEKVRGGYSVAVAGYIAFFPHRFGPAGRQKLGKDKFNVETINSKTKKLTVV